jgi:hypothetical protein
MEDMAKRFRELYYRAFGGRSEGGLTDGQARFPVSRRVSSAAFSCFDVISSLKYPVTFHRSRPQYGVHRDFEAD